jgi:S-adenosylmethionine synthetase
MSKVFFTSESVTSGHPDKVCDYIADSILDAAIAQDPESHMAVECTIKDDLILIYGEAGTKADIDYEKIALNAMKEIGYEEEYHVMVKVNKQSSEINGAVAHDEISAGDQGIMFGYADDETDDLMPFAIDCAHKLAKKLEEVRRQTPCLRPDGKTQVTCEYVDGKLARIDTIVVSTQHTADGIAG